MKRIVVYSVLAAGLLALAPWILVQVRIATAENAMTDLRTRLVHGGRFVGFENGALRPTEGTDYLVLGAAGTPEAGSPLVDPWGNPYRVRFRLDQKVYSLESSGPDGVDGPCRSEEANADDLCLTLGGR